MAYSLTLSYLKSIMFEHFFSGFSDYRSSQNSGKGLFHDIDKLKFSCKMSFKNSFICFKPNSTTLLKNCKETYGRSRKEFHLKEIVKHLCNKDENIN